jgi:hypothetical protein
VVRPAVRQATRIPRREIVTRFNTLCSLEAWQDASLVGAMRRMLPYYVDAFPTYPAGLEHRKHWEFAQLEVGLDRLGVLDSDATIISIGAGREELVFDLTNYVRWVFATDIYGSGNFAELEAEAGMLIDPDACARCAYRRNRLVVQYMDALDLRHEDETFDAAVSASSIEHFGSVDGAISSLREMARVVRRRGVVALTTECIINGAPRWTEPGLDLFTPDDIADIASAVPGLELVEPLDLDASALQRLPVIPLPKAIDDAARGHIDYPHVVLELNGRRWTSVSMFFRKRAA